MKLIRVILFTALFVIFTNKAEAKFTVNSTVEDQAGLFSSEQKTILEQKIAQIKNSTTSEIAIVTILNLGNDTIESKAVSIFQDLGIGNKEKDNGLLILVAKDDRKIRMEVGYGLEGVLTDLTTKKITENFITPEFKNGKYFEGLSAGLDQISAILIDPNSAVSLSTSESKQSNSNIPIDLIFFLIFVGIQFVAWFVTLLAKSKSWWAGGVVGAIAGAIIGTLLGLTLITFLTELILATLAGLGFDYFISKNNRFQEFLKKSQRSRDSGGGFFGGFSSGSSGGGFGGFSGGSSGGGGSSSSW